MGNIYGNELCCRLALGMRTLLGDAQHHVEDDPDEGEARLAMLDVQRQGDELLRCVIDRPMT